MRALRRVFARRGQHQVCGEDTSEQQSGHADCLIALHVSIADFGLVGRRHSVKFRAALH
jgi:hypothetical protein